MMMYRLIAHPFRSAPLLLYLPVSVCQQANTADSTSEKKSRMLSTYYRVSIDPSVIHISVRDAHTKNLTEATISKWFQRLEQ
jgi:hypothetical protein